MCFTGFDPIDCNLRQYVESNIIFHSFNEPANIKVGTKLEETLIEFYHTENIDDNKVTHEYI